MTFGISNSVKSQQVQICTSEMLREAIDSPRVAQVCAEIRDALEQCRRGELAKEEFEEKKGRLKKQLPILTPHATFRNGRRLNADAVPSGLSMYDLDHIPDPEGHWHEIEPRKDELGIVMAHITPSTEGLRLVFIIPQGMNLAQAQRWMAEQLGGIPTHGSRNNCIFTMACHLRYVCNDDPEWIARILPTYGENREKWMATIRSACNRNQSPRLPRLMQRVLAICKEREREEREAEENPDLPPQMPRILPPLIRLLVSKTPDIYKPAVAHAVFPALAAHLWQTRFRYIDNVEHEATLMNVLMAGTGAGKNCISEPINRIMADIRQRDMDNLRREREWKKEVQSKGANKDKRQRPEGLVIQEIDPDMTNAAFVQRLADAEDRFLYTKMNEIDQFDALKGSARGKAQFQIMCLAFDPRNVYGQTRIGTGSVSERVSIRFNWNACTTVQKGRRYFSQVLTDGPISRINFCTIPEREIGAEMPVYGTYDEAFDEELRPYIENLNKARGLVDCPKARTLAKRLMEECADFSRLSQSRVYENLSFRANVIAYLKAMVLFVASGGKWDKTVENFIRWSLQYDLWCKMRFFGQDIEMAENAHYASASKRGPQNLLDLLPDVFTREEVQLLRQKLGMERGSLKAMLSAWRQRGYIELYGEEMPHSELNQQRYEKTDFYLRNKSHAVNSKQ